MSASRNNDPPEPDPKDQSTDSYPDIPTDDPNAGDATKGKIPPAESGEDDGGERILSGRPRETGGDRD